MDATMVASVRRFNRTVTQRVGALDDRYLSRDRPLGEARLLWEIGERGCEVRALRARLDLDSGYLSRMLRSLERAGLVRVTPDRRDRRVRTTYLTAKGTTERALLDRRSEALARSFLAPLDTGERRRLLTAMADVERLLTAALLEISAVDSRHAAAQYCLHEYFAEIHQRFDTGFDPSRTLSADVLRPPSGMFLVASIRSQQVGCGGLQFHGRDKADIKRMWVAPSVRGLGIGRRLLAELESRAARRGAAVVRLETNRTLTEAIAMYRSLGYLEVEPFNDEPYAHYWFEKRLRAAKARAPR
jgi:DNA-binding MarR family transcriptional regulator/GNAT superfamily N-acetyltransferase